MRLRCHAERGEVEGGRNLLPESEGKVEILRKDILFYPTGEKQHYPEKSPSSSKNVPPICIEGGIGKRKGYLRWGGAVHARF